MAILGRSRIEDVMLRPVVVMVLGLCGLSAGAPARAEDAIRLFAPVPSGKIVLRPPAERGAAWEAVTAADLLQGGADLLILRHTKTLEVVRRAIRELVGTG